MDLKFNSLVFFVFVIGGVMNNVGATTFNFKNNCGFTVWPGTLSNAGAAPLANGGFALAPGATNQVGAPAGWAGRWWGRTGCNFDSAGSGTCVTGDCGGLHCTGGGVPPVSLVEFTLNGDGGKDFYDVSVVDGFNVAVGVKPINGGTGDCTYAGCVADLNGSCPSELQVKDSSNAVVACKSACAAFNQPQYCCTGDHNTAQTCPPTMYSKMFKSACPTAYSYAFDDPSSTRTCTGSDYLITFCSTGP